MAQSKVDVKGIVEDEILRCEENAKTWAHCKCVVCQRMAQSFRSRADRLRLKLKEL